MLMFSRLYDSNHKIFFEFLNNLIDTTNNNFDILFNLQPRGAKSVPDASIEQKGFKLIIETKVGSKFNVDQLTRHLESLRDSNAEVRVLLTMDKLENHDTVFNEFHQKLNEYNEKLIGNTTPIIHIHRTFEDIINIMEKHIDTRNYEIEDVFEEFKEFCLDEKLFDNSKLWMRGITVKTTYDSNLKNNLYYDGYDRGFSDHGYIGLYKDKAIRAIGKISKQVIGYMDNNGEYKIELERGGKITEEEKERIYNAVSDSKHYYENALEVYKHRFFLVDKFYPIEFYKATGGPIQRSKFFNLVDILNRIDSSLVVDNKLPSTETIAKALDGKNWEDVL